jgi:hypothetical protein
MFSCKKCSKEFRDSYNLSKHMLRKKPCTLKKSKNSNDTDLIFAGNTSSDQLISSSDQLISSFGELKSSFQNNQNCMYCLNSFSIKTNLKKHHTICKFREDPVRLLEIERGIKPEAPPSKTECRFCNRDYLRMDNLHRHLKGCKDREDYHKALIKQGQQQQQQCTVINNTIYNGPVNNTTNTTNTINTININNFGEETLDHISNRDFLLFLKKYYKSINNSENKLLVGNFLIDFEKMISKDPSNQNAWITNVKSDYGIIKFNGEEKLLRFNDFAEKVLVNTSKKLSDRHDTFSEENELDESLNQLLIEACEYRYGLQHYKDLPKKQLKELIDNLRISKVKN